MITVPGLAADALGSFPRRTHETEIWLDEREFDRAYSISS